MKRIANNKYIKNNVTREWLANNGFRYNKTLSNNDDDIFTYRFPVYKYCNCTILECEILIHIDNGETKIDVYNNGTITMYPPFYYEEYGGYDEIVGFINKKIINKLNKLEIKEIKNKKGKQK